MKEIPLTQGKVAIVDNEDFQSVNKWKWHLGSSGRYAARDIIENGKKRKIYMHREILNPPIGMDSDHKNGNKLDNRRDNLRCATRAQNMINRAEPANNTSGSKGVVYNKANRKFIAQLSVAGKNIYLGSYSTLEQANAAYQSAAIKLHGEFAMTL